MMRQFLNQWRGESSSVNTFVASMQSERYADGDDHTLLPALELFHTSPRAVAEYLFTYIATAPRELTDLASQVLDASKGVVLTEEEQIDLKALAISCKELGEQMDRFTKNMASDKAWSAIYNAPISVTRVWRTKRGEEVVGTPEVRNVPIDQVPNRLSSLVLVEEESSKGVTRRPMLSVSDGRYQLDGPIGEVRADFLIDIPAMFAHGADVSPRGRMGRGCGQKGTERLFTRTMTAALPLLEATLAVAEPLVRRGVLESDLYQFDEVIDYTPGANPLKAEDNPNAKYDIGGWA